MYICLALKQFIIHEALSSLAVWTNTHISYSIPDVRGSLVGCLRSGKMGWLTGWFTKRFWISLLCSHQDFRKVLWTSCSQVHKSTVTNTGRTPPVFRVLQTSWRKQTWRNPGVREMWEQEVYKGMLLWGWGFPFAFGVFWCWREVYFCIFSCFVFPFLVFSFIY